MPAILVPITQLSESYHERVEVAGDDALVVGVRRGAAERALNLGDLAVNLPATSTGSLCVSLATKDGRYTGSRGYKIQQGASGPQSLQLSSKFQRQLSGFQSGQLAVRTVMASDCEHGRDRVLLLSEFYGETHDNKLYVSLKTQYSDPEITFYDKNKTVIASARCVMSSSGASTTYDHECEAEISPSQWANVVLLSVKVVGLTGASRKEQYPIVLGPY